MTITERMEEKMQHRIYVWATSVPNARSQAIAKLREQGHKPPFPDLEVKWTGLSRPGSYDVNVGNDGYGSYIEVVGNTSRRYAVDPVL
jgi:hypothetical protein